MNKFIIQCAIMSRCQILFWALTLGILLGTTFLIGHYCVPYILQQIDCLFLGFLVKAVINMILFILSIFSILSTLELSDKELPHYVNGKEVQPRYRCKKVFSFCTNILVIVSIFILYSFAVFHIHNWNLDMSTICVYWEILKSYCGAN